MFPMQKKSNATYVIAINYVPLNDLSVDGFIYNKHSCPTQNVEVVYHHDNLVASKVVSTNENKGQNIYKMHRQYSYASAVSMADAELKRKITRFEWETPVNELFQKAHGNSNQRRELYNRKHPSVIKRIKKESEHFSPKNVLSNIQN